jgi:hypothetical protein
MLYAPPRRTQLAQRRCDRRPLAQTRPPSSRRQCRVPTLKASSIGAAPLAPLRTGVSRSSTSLALGSTGTIGSTSKIRKSRTPTLPSTLIEPVHAPVGSKGQKPNRVLAPVWGLLRAKTAQCTARRRRTGQIDSKAAVLALASGFPSLQFRLRRHPRSARGDRSERAKGGDIAPSFCPSFM